jgi:predicted ester cyclase
MSAATLEELGRKFFESQDRRKGGPDPDLCASGYVARIGSNPPMTIDGHDGFAKAFYAGFPDISHTIEDTVADDSKVAVIFTLRGTHTGDFMGVPPTQKQIEVGAIAVLIVAAGKVAEVRGQFDQLGMMQQLGVA